MIHLGDCLAVLPTLEAESVDAIVTDPPYGLGFMGKAWDHAVPGVPFWLEMLRVAKPGAYLAAFGGTRTFHRMACAIEDAGWELRDTLMWVYGSGFPKSHNGEWGGTALKPAWEPIILARKPLSGTVEANWRQHGTGALNIDGCRVAGAERPLVESDRRSGANGTYGDGLGGSRANGETSIGRWPANLVHDGSEEVVNAFPRAPGQIAKASTSDTQRGWQNTYGVMARGSNGQEPRADAGSAARFFYCAKASKADRDHGLRAFAQVKVKTKSGGGAPNEGREAASDGGVRANIHPTVKPTDLMRWLCRLITPPGGLVLDPFAGSGSTGRAAVAEGMRFQGIELSPEYAAIAEARIRAVQPGLGF